MKKRVGSWAVMVVLTAFGAGPSLAEEDAAVLKDLTATIALQGQPCGRVVGAVRQGDSDYVASCQDGHRYRVFINPQGRVVVEKL